MIANIFLNLHLQKDRPFLNKISQIQFSLLEGLRILVVDDNQDSQFLVQMIFEYYQAQVKTATSALEAIKTMKEWQPDILISDIWMNDKDSYWLIRSIREKQVSQGRFIPAIAVTGYVENLDDALSAGYQNVMLKPFDPDKLVAEVAFLVQRYHSFGLKTFLESEG
jgi:CheY-like chemotaxis protein